MTEQVLAAKLARWRSSVLSTILAVVLVTAGSSTSPSASESAVS